jgi:molybdopterin synthase catalytic subunit
VTVIQMLRQFRAQREAVTQYSEAARRWFEEEDQARRRADLTSARIFHRRGVLTGHAAFLEETNPEVVR